MGFAGAGRTEQQQIGAAVEPAGGCRQRHHLGLAERWHSGEVEARERLAGGQAGLGEMTLDAAARTLGEFVLSEGGKKTRRRPAFVIGLGGEFLPHQPDRGQAQLGEHQLNARGLNGGVHAMPPSPTNVDVAAGVMP
jgi:hypothetical protein